MPAADRPRRAITSPAVWRSSDPAAVGDWTYVLTDSQRDEIRGAVAHAKALGRSRATLVGDDFPLPRLDGRIDEWAGALRSGRGFMLVRGFPVDELEPDEIELAYVGVGLKLGTPVSQDAQGSLLGHVRDRGAPRTGPEVRLYATRERQDFHTDGADIIGLLCVQRAKRGGESRIVSAAAIYNEILAHDPRLLDVLYEPMYWDRNNEQSVNEEPFFRMPVLHDVDGNPRFFYIGWYIRDAQRHAQVPRLTADQVAAMDLIESIANDPAFYVEMQFRPGDVQLLNNSVILHSREAYVDYDEPTRKRHLLRLWLRAHEFSSVEDRLRSGIPQRAVANESPSSR
jgi:hypothetical protein